MPAEPLEPTVDEEQCAVCSRVPPAEREAFRASLDRMPLDDAVCDACLMAWWRNLGFSVSETDEPEPDESNAR